MVLLKDMEIPRGRVPKDDGDDNAFRERMSDMSGIEIRDMEGNKVPGLTLEEFKKKYPHVPGQWTEYTVDCPEGRPVKF